MGRINGLLAKEYSHFQKLGQNAKDLLVSYAFYGIGAIAWGIFVGAYLWSKTADIVTVSIYYIVTFTVLYFAFILNGLLLAKVGIRKLFSLGLIISGLSAITLVFFKEISLEVVILASVLDGVGSGLYWANRNFLTGMAVKDDERDYFFGLNSISVTISGILIPIATGFLIEHAGGSVLGSKENAYRLVMAIVALAFAYGAYVLHDNHFQSPKIERLFFDKVTPSWQMMRLAAFLDTFRGGVMTYFSVILVFTFLGEEGVLGTMETVMAIIIMILTYLLARILGKGSRGLLIMSAGVIFAVGALGFSAYNTAITALLFILLNKLSASIVGVYIQSIWYATIEKESPDPSTNYVYFVDSELFINLGRICGIGSLLLMHWLLPEHFVLRSMVILVMFSQLALGYICMRLVKKLHINPEIG